MKILIVSATPFEIAPLINWFADDFSMAAPNLYTRSGLNIQVLISGVGMMHTAFALGKHFATQRPDLAINAGIAGAFQKTLKLGEVVNVISERFGDLGVEEADGTFTDIHKLGLIEKDQLPFQKGLLINPEQENATFLPCVHGITVNKVHGNFPNIEQIRKLHPDVDIESMEGAAFFYACLKENIPFLQIRSISNYIESRNRSQWKIEIAIDNLCRVVKDMLTTLE